MTDGDPPTQATTDGEVCFLVVVLALDKNGQFGVNIKTP